MFVNVIAFGEAACAALLALDAGDAVAGTLTPKAWTDREGVVRPALDLVASQVLSAYHVARKRRAVEPGAPAAGWPLHAAPVRQASRASQAGQPGQASQPGRHDDLDDGAPLDF